MSAVLDIEDTGMDGTVPQIAYVLLVALSALFDVTYEGGSGLMGGHISIKDEEGGEEMFRVLVDPTMAELFMAVLNDVGPMVQEAVRSEAWTSSSY